jgi:hypothetical protein
MKRTLLILIFFVISKSFSQNRLSGIIVDSETKKTIEYVDIYNSIDFTSTNSEGNFLFVSEKDSIKIRLLGYKPISSTFKKIRKDTIFLESKFEMLDEIILGNSNLITSVYKELYNNYPFSPYTESFFLRCLLKKDGQIIKLQDLNGLVKRKTLFPSLKKSMPKKNYKVQILNMRKAGIKDDINGLNVYFKMFNFKQILDISSSVKITDKSYNFKEIKSKNKEYTKYLFSPKADGNLKNEGYYLVKNIDKAIIEYKVKRIITNNLFTEKKEIKYRTTSYETFVTFKKNIVDNLYYVDKTKITAQMEVLKEDKKVLYDIEYSWITLNKTEKEVDKNISINKDIFKLKKSFNSDFWNKQKYLLLTNEMSKFLKKLESSQNEFKTITNIK